MKKYQLPENLEDWIEKYLNRNSFSLSRPHELSKAILEVSDQFKSSSSSTPWNKPANWAAYLSYYFPLNYIRNSKILDEAKSHLPKDIDMIFDFGCGPGTFTKALLNSGDLNTNKIIGCDIEDRVGALFLDTSRSQVDLSFQKTALTNPPKNSLVIASYVLNELKDIPEWLFNYEHIIIAEPSTKQAFPTILKLRNLFLEKSYNINAPCSHSQNCPLAESKKDWCHDRVHWEQPEWFKKIEAALPIKNKTLSYSYLIASKTHRSDNDFWRVVGDPLVEKGKTRWMLCRNNEREFLSHLKRQGSPPEIHRGDKVQIKSFEKKSNEIRYNTEDLKVF